MKNSGAKPEEQALSSTLGPPHGHQQQFYVNKLISEWETRFPKQEKKKNERSQPPTNTPIVPVQYIWRLYLQVSNWLGGNYTKGDINLKWPN